MILLKSILCETIRISLTKQDAQEVLYKLGTLASEPDLQEDYGLSQAQATELVKSIPVNGGAWNVSEEMINAIKGEMADHVVVLRDIAADALNSDKRGESLRINKQARRLEILFNL